MVIEKRFKLPILLQSNFFNSHHKVIDWKVRRGASHMSYVEGFPKTYNMPFFLTNWKTLITIKQWGCVKWQLVFFDRHLTHPHHRMATKNFRSPKRAWGYAVFSKFILHAPPFFLVIEKFQSPSNIPHHQMTTERGWPMLSFSKNFFFLLLSHLGYQRILVAIQWCACLGWQPKFFSCHSTMGLCQTATKGFFITTRYTPNCSMVTKTNSVAPKGMGWRAWNDNNNKGRVKKNLWPLREITLE